MEVKKNILLFLILAFAFTACSPKAATVKKDRPVVVILGIDGACWNLIDPLVAKGRLPLFKELKEKYAWGYLRTSTPAKSPIIWTSIATGKTQAKHGIDDFRSKKKDARGKFSMFTSRDIREALLWDMLDVNRRRSVLVNWYLSYPPQPLNGVNVSDYFRSSAISSNDKKKNMLSQTVFPPERSAELVKFLVPDYRQALKSTNLPDFPELYKQMNTGIGYLDLPIFKNYPEWVVQEKLVDDVADHLFRSEDFDLFAAYFKMSDVVQHFAFMSFIDDAYKKILDRSFVNGKLPDDLETQAYAKIADIVCPVYQNLERSIGRFLNNKKYRDAYFIILSDHGFSFFFRNNTVRYNHVGPEIAPDGIIIMRGPGIKPGKIKLARIYDIAPTVLYLLDLPLDRRMDGEPLLRLLTFRHDSHYTVYKKKKPQPFKKNLELDEKNLQELKALGYIN
ncbi:MAG: alkaline phosphatase family protein [Candidatus Aminicenantes bacterium]|nr:alkaline phosphatase family protein [Candidatus Aminicenantes bacterium]